MSLPDVPVERPCVMPNLVALVGQTPTNQLPSLIGRLAEAQAVAFAKLATPSARKAYETEDVNLSAKEAARRLGVSPDFLYKNKLPFKVKVGRRVLFSSRALERWNQQRHERY